jgi:hypothetical protein
MSKRQALMGVGGVIVGVLWIVVGVEDRWYRDWWGAVVLYAVVSRTTMSLQ